MAEKVKDHTRMLGVVMMVTGFSASYKEYTLNKDKLAIANFFPRLIYFPCWPFFPNTTPVVFANYIPLYSFQSHVKEKRKTDRRHCYDSDP